MNLPQNKLDPRVKNVWRINAAIWITLGLIVLAGSFLPLAIIEETSFVGVPLIIITIAIAVVLYVIFIAILPPLRYARWSYEISPEYLDMAKGIIWRRRYTIPFIRVQNTDTRQGPILRAFHLSNVTVATAASEHVIPGLDAHMAEELRDRAAELARLAREDV